MLLTIHFAIGQNVVWEKKLSSWLLCLNLQETWTSTLKAAQSRWSEAVALELAAETEKMNAFQNVNDGEVEQDTGPKSPDDPVMSQTQMLSYYKPIESQCWRNTTQSQWILGQKIN